ncbi:lipocalin family protein [Cupriavidus respiraculi]|nr:lipocalin family protein [Cupriavidus respiraculi]
MFNAHARAPVGNPNVPQPAKPVELERYLGRWYELARYDNRFERGCDAVTADYALRDDGLIEVINTCGRDEDGKPRASHGKAKVVDEAGKAKLKVSFFGPFYVGDYWVLDHADDYSWSIVGEPSGKYLWILHRSPRPDVATWDMLTSRVHELGYDLSLLRPTQHEPAAERQPQPA